MKTKDRPGYYGGNDNPYEARKIIEVWNLGFNLDTAFKYIVRLGKKDDESMELNKIRNYILFEIERNEKLVKISSRQDGLWRYVNKGYERGHGIAYRAQDVIKELKVKDALIIALINLFDTLTCNVEIEMNKFARLGRKQILCNAVTIVDEMIQRNSFKKVMKEREKNHGHPEDMI